MVKLGRRISNRLIIRMVTFLMKIMRLEKRIFWILALCLGWSLTALADNEIEIKNQEGTNLNLLIDQVGSNNVVQCYISTSCWVEGNNMSIHFYQFNESSETNTIEIWHLDGASNSVRWGQGAYLSNSTDTTFDVDDYEGGGHYARHDIHGDNNTIVGYQQNAGDTLGHHYESLIFSDNNDIWIRQKNNGEKYIKLTTYSDYNEISILQKTNGADHSATITLSGTDPTILDLKQQGSTDQTYNLSQTCLTPGGCNITVVQGN